MLELARGVGERVGEHLLHPVVDLLDDGEQVPPGLAEVLELGLKERVPLFQRGELLQRQRVDLPKLVKLPLRRVSALALDVPVIRDGRLVLPRQPGTGTSGPYSATRTSSSTANSSVALPSTCSSFIRRLARDTSAPWAALTTLSSWAEASLILFLAALSSSSRR